MDSVKHVTHNKGKTGEKKMERIENNMARM